MTQRDLAGLLNINVKTLRKWKKDRPKVYELLLIGLEAKNILSTLKTDCESLEKMIEKWEMSDYVSESKPSNIRRI